jgi:hypothetical protein
MIPAQQDGRSLQSFCRGQKIGENQMQEAEIIEELTTFLEQLVVNDGFSGAMLVARYAMIFSSSTTKFRGNGG